MNRPVHAMEIMAICDDMDVRVSTFNVQERTIRCFESFLLNNVFWKDVQKMIMWNYCICIYT